MPHVEGTYTVRDLLATEPPPEESFPQDDMAFGFDNIGSALHMSLAHVEKYVDAAEQLASAAVIAP